MLSYHCERSYLALISVFVKHLNLNMQHHAAQYYKAVDYSLRIVVIKIPALANPNTGADSSPVHIDVDSIKRLKIKECSKIRNKSSDKPIGSEILCGE
jgi:hypothetical protein